ncbi:MAG: bifunctional nuclease domain-containing protein [Chlamydiota bacterium]
MSELIPITFNKILQSKSYTVIILGTHQKKFAIYTEPRVGKDLQIYLTQGKKIRPSCHDLLLSVFEAYRIHPIQVVIHDVEDTIYFARLFLEMISEGKRSILELDAKPSDCITLALLQNIPLYCRKEVLDKTVSIEG